MPFWVSLSILFEGCSQSECGERADGTAVSLGKSSSTALEGLYRQTVALVDLMSEDGGPGSFINVHHLLQSSGKPWQR